MQNSNFFLNWSQFYKKLESTMNLLFFISLFFSILYIPIHAEYPSLHTVLHWGYQKNNNNFKESKFYHNNTRNKVHADFIYSYQIPFSKYNAQDFHDYFVGCKYTEKEILEQHCLYMFDEFVKFAQTYSCYKNTIQRLHAELKHLTIAQKAYGIAKGTYCRKLQKRIHHLYNQVNMFKDEASTYKVPILKEPTFETFSHHEIEYVSLKIDHKALVESFMAIDVNQAATTILENNNSYESVANEMNDLAKHVFVNARHCNLSNLPKIESHVYNSIDAMRTAQDHPTFIFNFSMVHHTLGDIQQIAHAILSGRHPVLERSSELLIRGFDKFFRGLNPITQASNIGHLASDLKSLFKKSGSALWNDPITTTHNGITTVFTLVELIRNTADFTSDLTVGKLYLSPEEYKQRTDAFYEMMKPLQGVTAEQCTDFVAQVAADVMFFKGLGNAYTFLKEINVLEKLGESAAAVTRTFKKGFDTHLANNPIVVTAEGVTIKLSDAMHNMNKGGGGKNIINSSKALLESAYAKIAVEVETEIAEIVQLYSKLPDGFAEFGHKPIRIAYKHVLGMELNLTKKGKLKLSGFHHDLKNAIEKSNILNFTNKTFNKHGCYKTILFDKGNYVKEVTFFPAHWSRREVVEKIHEAYSNFIKTGIIPELSSDGKYIISGLTNEGLEIEMCFTIGGEMKTAYPRSNGSFILGDLNGIR